MITEVNFEQELSLNNLEEFSFENFKETSLNDIEVNFDDFDELFFKNLISDDYPEIPPFPIDSAFDKSFLKKLVSTNYPEIPPFPIDSDFIDLPIFVNNEFDSRCSHGKFKGMKCEKCNQKIKCQDDKVRKNRLEYDPKLELRCDHNTRKKYCTKCNPILLCDLHNKRKSNCKECNLCLHNKRKSSCIKCNPFLLCDLHNKRKNDCKECNVFLLCLHEIRKKNCKKCNPSLLCIHNKRKSRCKKCKECK